MAVCMNVAVTCVVIAMCSYVETANINYMKQTIRDHFSENRNHFVNKTYKDATMKFIYDEFKKFGLDTEYNHFTYGNLQPMSPHVTASPSQTTFTNVVGVLKGTEFGTANDSIIAVGAHYDTTETTKGVDDNGAGVAAMLESARQITQMKVERANTIIFVSFDLEEYNLIGSDKFIKTWVNPWLVKNYGRAAMNVKPYGVIVLDTMMEYNTSRNSQTLPTQLNTSIYFPDTYNSISSDGFQGDFLSLIYRKPTPDAHLADTFKSIWDGDSRTEFEIETLPIPFAAVDRSSDMFYILRDLFRSDHTNFWIDNIPAIFISDTANFRGDMQYCYHKMCDDLETMLTDDNLNFLGKTADTIAKTLHSLSDPAMSGGKSVIQSTFSIYLLLCLALLSTLLH